MGWRTGFGCDDCGGIHLQAGCGATEGKGRIHSGLLPGNVGESPNLVKLAFVSAFG
jgi:hypothetical protein